MAEAGAILRKISSFLKPSAAERAIAARPSAPAEIPRHVKAGHKSHLAHANHRKANEQAPLARRVAIVSHYWRRLREADNATHGSTRAIIARRRLAESPHRHRTRRSNSSGRDAYGHDRDRVTGIYSTKACRCQSRLLETAATSSATIEAKNKALPRYLARSSDSCGVRRKLSCRNIIAHLPRQTRTPRKRAAHGVW